MLIFGNVAEKLSFALANDGNTHKWVIGLVTKKVLKTYVHYNICPKMTY